MKLFGTSIIIIFKKGIIGSLSTVFKMAYIIIPIMIILEIIKYFGMIDKITSIFSPFLKNIGLSYKATFPLLIGVFLGITYSSGVMLDSIERDELTNKEITLILIFLVVCHAIIEDTFIFWLLGSNFFILFFGRIIGAILITGVFSKLIKEKEQIREVYFK